MARRKKKGKTGRFLLVTAIIGAGSYYLWRSGKWQTFYGSIFPPGVAPPPPIDPVDLDLPIDETGNILLAVGAGLAAVLKWLEEHGEEEPIDPPPEPPILPPIDPPIDPPVDPVDVIDDPFTPPSALEWAAAAALSAFGIGKVIEQGEHWRDIYAALTPEQQAAASAIVGAEPGKIESPSSMQEQKDLITFAMELENEEAAALLTSAERKLLDSYAMVLGL